MGAEVGAIYIVAAATGDAPEYDRTSLTIAAVTLVCVAASEVLPSDEPHWDEDDW